MLTFVIEQSFQVLSVSIQLTQQLNRVHTWKGVRRWITGVVCMVECELHAYFFDGLVRCNGLSLLDFLLSSCLSPEWTDHSFLCLFLLLGL